MVFCVEEEEEDEGISLSESLSNHIHNEVSSKETITRLEAQNSLQEEMLIKQDDEIRKLKRQKRNSMMVK